MTNNTPAPMVMDPVTKEVMHVEQWLAQASTLVELRDIESTMGPSARQIAEGVTRAIANFTAVIGRPPTPDETMKIMGAVARYVLGQDEDLLA